jgi:hypothetical protein
MRINNTFSKDSSDCLSTLSTATELLHLLVTLDTPEEEQTPLRTFLISVPELRQYLSWAEEREHPLYDLEKLLVVRELLQINRCKRMETFFVFTHLYPLQLFA